MPTEEEIVGLRRQAERLATLATLARPVQHEINNLLTVIFANLEMLKRKLAEGPPQRQLDRIHEAARRFEISTRAILALSRQPVPCEAEFPLAEAVAAIAPLLRVLLPAPGALSLTLPEPADAAWKVRLDRARLNEGLIGLAMAAAATEPQRAATLDLSVTHCAGEAGADRITLAARLAGVLPEEAALPLSGMRALAEEAGGRLLGEAEEGAIRLDLPRHREAGTSG